MWKAPYTLDKYRRLVEQAMRVKHPQWNDEQVKVAAQATINRFTKQEAA